LEIFAGAGELAQALATRVAVQARASLAARGSFTLALAGGSTPKAAYALLGTSPLRESVDWSRVRFFFGDERCVPPADDQSNYKMARESLLDVLRIAPSAVFRMRGEDEPAAAARDYAAILRRELAFEGEVPILDLVMLGMGPDGHTASLFPGTDPFEDDALLVKAPYVAKFSSYRISLTPRVLTSARAVVVATEGEAKAEALAAVLDGPYDPLRLPIQILRGAGERLSWLVDRAAAGRLSH
jgi:6-phosphogluconolactonase